MASEPNKKRELIFLTLAGIGIIYGAIYYVMRNSDKATISGGDTVLTETTFSLVTEELSETARTKQEAKALGILNAISSTWPDNAFIDITSFVEEDEEHAEEEVLTLEETIIYSGYMNMGEKIFAVINGIEYMIGDIVEGLILQEINPMEIIMEKNGRPIHIPFKQID
jgi:hypothetical protein